MKKIFGFILLAFIITNANAQWVAITPSNAAKSFAVDYRGNLAYFTDNNNNVMGVDLQTKQISMPLAQACCLTQVSLSGNLLFGIGTDSKIYLSSLLKKNTWNPTTGYAKRLSTRHGVYVIGTDDGIFQFEQNVWVQVPGGGKGKDIACSSDGVFVIGLDDAIWKNLLTNITPQSSGTWTGWSKISVPPVKPKRIYVEDRKIWILGDDNYVYYVDFKNLNSWKAYDKTAPIIATDIDVKDGVPYIVGIDGTVYAGTTVIPSN